MTNLIKDFQALQNAIHSGELELNIGSSIMCHHSIILPEGSQLRGIELEDGSYPLLMFNSSDGIGVTANNIIQNINIHTQCENRAIYNTIIKENLGCFTFENIKMAGQFSFITRHGVMNAEVSLNHIHVISCDSRKYLEMPQKYGVNALQGALTIYNLNSDENSKIKVQLNNISIGIKDSPVVGSGIFIAGFGDIGGIVEIEKLHTLNVYSTGKIPFSVADMITAGVFVVNGAKAIEVIHDGEVITYGVNDMVLDLWGEVESWTCNYPIISYGPSGVGFVNFGKVGSFIARAPLKAFGLGARGYNQYDGTVNTISFHSITTFGDGSVGIQVSKKIGTIHVENDVITHGSIGNTLVKGVNVKLPAYAISIKEGGEVQSININGDIKTFGDHVISYSVEGGVVNEMKLKGTIEAYGKDSSARN